MKINKIISGGQTGVDMAALKVAKNLQIETGGWAPPAMQNEVGKIPDIYNLKPTPDDRSSNAPDIPHSQRTELNVKDSDGALIILPYKEFHCQGTNLALQLAKRLGKPVFTIFLNEKISKLEFRQWLNENQIQILSIGGPSESSIKGIEKTSTETLKKLMTNQ